MGCFPFTASGGRRIAKSTKRKEEMGAVSIWSNVMATVLQAV